MSEHTPDARIAAHKAVDAIVLKREHPTSMPSEWAALAKEAHAAIDHALKMVAPDLLAALESITKSAEAYMKYHSEKFYPSNAPPIGLWPKIEECKAVLEKARKA